MEIGEHFYMDHVNLLEQEVLQEQHYKVASQSWRSARSCRIYIIVFIFNEC